MLATIFIYLFVTIILSLAIVYGGSIISGYTQNENTKMVINWFTLLAILNVMIMMFILASYNTLQFKPGPAGPAGKRGVIGASGKDGSCVMCKPAIDGLKPIRPLNKIDQIDTMHPNDERKQLFTRESGIIERENEVHQYIQQLYIKTFDFVNNLGYEEGLTYNIRQGFARFYGLYLSNHFKKHRDEYTINKLKSELNRIGQKLNDNKNNIINQIHYIRNLSQNDQQKKIESLINRETYGHDI